MDANIAIRRHSAGESMESARHDQLPTNVFDLNSLKIGLQPICRTGALLLETLTPKSHSLKRHRSGALLA